MSSMSTHQYVIITLPSSIYDADREIAASSLKNYVYQFCQKYFITPAKFPVDFHSTYNKCPEYYCDGSNSFELIDSNYEGEWLISKKEKVKLAVAIETNLPCENIVKLYELNLIQGFSVHVFGSIFLHNNITGLVTKLFKIINEKKH